MINVEKMSYGFPEKDLYENVSFTIEDGQHCALIGSNGTGKTTLVDMLIHTEDYLYDGKIKKDIQGRIGYVNQFLRREKQRQISVYDYLAEDFLLMQAKIDDACMKMSAEDAAEDAFDYYQQVMDEFDAVDGYNYDVNIHQQLRLSGMTKLTDLMLEQLSGGEYKLLQIIKQMLLLPGLLVLDEPDVFLDFENIGGLCRLINAYKGTLLAVTHNRYLLNHCFNKILHLENGDVQEFEGNYTDYQLALLYKKVELQEQARKDAEEIERQQALVDKLREEATRVSSSSRGKTLKARVSYLGRLEKRQIKAPFVDVRQPHPVLPAVTELTGSETELLKVEDYHLSFEDELLDQISFSVRAGEKVCIVGANGTGKSTLLRDLIRKASGQDTIGSALITFADGEKVAYLSQLSGEMADESMTVMEALEARGLEDRREAAKVLSVYCLEEALLDQQIRFLSGGEKNLLEIALMSFSEADLLLMDEPTSHLDLYGQVALEKAINDYPGAVLMVSHDFYTIAGCADHVLLIEDHAFRQMSVRAFRKMIYRDFFEKNDLSFEQRKKELEMKAQSHLKHYDYDRARAVCDQLAELIAEKN